MSEYYNKGDSLDPTGEYEMNDTEHTDDAREMCICGHAHDQHYFSPIASSGDSCEGLRCPCKGFRRNTPAPDDALQREKAADDWRTTGAGDWDIVGDERSPCYAAWTIYRNGQEALGECADIVDFRTGFKAGFTAGLLSRNHIPDIGKKVGEPMKIVVYKDGTHIFAEHTWEQENDPDWLVTINPEIARHSEASVNDFVETIFTSGDGAKADRLILRLDGSNRDLGGWSRKPIADRILDFIRSRKDDVVDENGLRPCPFCGEAESLHLLTCTDDAPDIGNNVAMCGRCANRTGRKRSEQEAIESWNRRTNG